MFFHPNQTLTNNPFLFLFNLPFLRILQFQLDSRHKSARFLHLFQSFFLLNQGFSLRKEFSGVKSVCVVNSAGGFYSLGIFGFFGEFF